jgi:adenylate cyclase
VPRWRCSSWRSPAYDAGCYPDLVKDCAATIAELCAWLVEVPVSVDKLADFIEALGLRLRESGVPIDRLTTGINTKQPEVSIIGARYSPGQGTQIGLVSYDMVQQELPHRSPFYDLIKKLVPEVRCRLLDGKPTPYPLVNRMREEGFTDYLALPLGEERISYATCAPDGFSDAHLAILRGI